MDTYKINAIKTDGSVDVTFSVDGLKQNISGLPVDDADALDEALCKYGLAYASGLEKAAVEVSDDAKALVGVSKEVKEEK